MTLPFLFCIILCIYCINYSIEKSRCKDIIKNNKEILCILKEGYI